MMKRMDTWHFINAPENTDYFKSQLDEKGDALRALIKAEKKLSDPNTSYAEKRDYLRFLGHFTGDIHQPLHTGRPEDLGGNRIKVSFLGRKTFVSEEILQVDSPNCNEEGQRIDAATGECVITKIKPGKEINLHKIWDLQLLEEYAKRKRLQNKKVEGDSRYQHLAYLQQIQIRVKGGEVSP